MLKTPPLGVRDGCVGGWTPPPVGVPGWRPGYGFQRKRPKVSWTACFLGGGVPPVPRLGGGSPHSLLKRSLIQTFCPFLGPATCSPAAGSDVNRVYWRRGVVFPGPVGGGSGPRGLGMGHLGPPHKERCFPSGALPPSKHANMAAFPKIGFFKHFCVMIATLPLSFCQLLKKMLAGWNPRGRWSGGKGRYLGSCLSAKDVPSCRS